jgi:taurine dioxygenase
VSRILIHPVTKAIGAEVRGVDLREPLAAEALRTLERALLDHHVLFFRDQALSPEQQIAFARHFGPIGVPPFAPKYGDDPELVVLDQTSPKGEGADSWHSDNTFMREPPMGSILRAVALPSLGGDTCFASMVAAHDALSPPIQRLVAGLRAEHDITRPLRRGIAAGHVHASLEEMQKRWPPVDHPVVRTHPVSGRKALFVNGNSTTRILGLSERESDVLLSFLIDHVRSPEFQCRFRWEVGSMAFWDNRTTQHFAVPDYAERRVMHRVTIAGDVPV